MERKITYSATKEFDKGIKITGEVSESNDSIYFRLRCNTITSQWDEGYRELHTLKLGERLFGLISNYYVDKYEDLPVLEPFEIIMGKEV